MVNVEKHEEKNQEDITYDLLNEKGKAVKTALDGSCILFEYNGVEYVVLSDNSVITREEDNECPEGAIFPFEKNDEIKKEVVI